MRMRRSHKFVYKYKFNLTLKSFGCQIIIIRTKFGTFLYTLIPLLIKEFPPLGNLDT